MGTNSKKLHSHQRHSQKKWVAPAIQHSTSHQWEPRLDKHRQIQYAIIQHQFGKGVESGMTDYCMCYGEGCKDKEICYRYRAKPTPGWQLYFKEQPGKDRNCGQFLRN
jgi:hypothetical protein